MPVIAHTVTRSPSRSNELPASSKADPAIDTEACAGYGVAAAIVESSADNPIGTLERFLNRKITKTNAKARAMGIYEGMDVTDALAVIA